jgi:hypothetical protein
MATKEKQEKAKQNEKELKALLQKVQQQEES